MIYVELDNYNLKHCVYAMQAVNDCLSKIGTGTGTGRRIMQQQIQTVIASIMHINKNGKLMNEESIKAILPQINWRNQNKMIIGCIARRIKFNKNQSQIIYKDYSNEHRMPR